MVQGSCTFALLGRDERAALPGVIAAARGAARPGDEVWLVDSASSDGSAEAAARLGVPVVEAAAGKGAAVAAALERWDGQGWLCLLDADLADAAEVARRLRLAAERSHAAMVVGEREDPPGHRRLVTPLVYRPLATALFPEVDEPRRRPLSGLRALSVRPEGPVPSGYGVEAHLNTVTALAGGRIEAVALGRVLDARRAPGHAARVAHEVASALLDLAVRNGRLDPARRPAWDLWVGEIVSAFGDPGAERAAAGRPLPSRRA